MSLPLASVERVAKEAVGAHRISAEATRDLVFRAEEYIQSIASEASKAADHAGRKTIRSEDIQFVLSE